jgi:hypothetical protein
MKFNLTFALLADKPVLRLMPELQGYDDCELIGEDVDRH